MSEWEQTTLGAIADLSIGRTPDRKNPDYWTTDTTYPFCTIADMPERSWTVNPTREGVTSAAITDGKAKLAPAGSLLMSFKLTIGRVGFAERDVYPNEAIVRIDPRDRSTVYDRYLAAWLESHDLMENAPRAVKGKTLNSKSLALISVVLPPLLAQEQIVEVIGTVEDQITALDTEAAALEGVYLAATSLLWLTSQGDEAETRALGDVMHHDVVRTPMESGTTYHLAGVLNSGKGLVDKDVFDGADTEYTAMNVLRANQVVMRKLTAWEGPITVVPAEFDGFVASNEFPTFTLADDIAPKWMKHACRTPRLWAEMQSRVVGTVQRRKRLNPDQLLSVALPVPSRPEQEQAAEALDAMEAQATTIRAEADRLRNVRARLLSGLLDRTIDIKSAELEF
ncbi:restriction endonuclease subunit S [Nocardiopsis sp. JB363]|uniref:restriction endonuclease subunit S n=1 Tax=Nocardiopsis sp. JB363 TaxID=1434837 RepID=UPI000B34F7D6|nr:restriction endonuclease subunit S [Nocardiopsis sp. JB363]